MSSVVNLKGKKYIEPGSYAVTNYSSISTVNVGQYGNVMIIDTGMSKMTINTVEYEFAGGSGFKGEIQDGLKSIYQFETKEDFRSFMGGGVLSDIVGHVFEPGAGNAGAPKLYYVRAATTTAASLVLTFATGETITLNCKNEGVCGNGIISDNLLKVGFSAKVIEGVAASTFVLQIFKGNYQGEDSYGEPYGTKTLDQASGELIIESEELETITDLYNWLINDRETTKYFTVEKTSTVGTTPLKVLAEAAFAGGTTVFLADGEFESILELITDFDVSFFLCTDYGVTNGVSTYNGKLFTFLKNDAKFTQFMVIGGGSDDSDLFGDSDSSEALAKNYNSEQVIIVHGNPEENRKLNVGTKQLPSIYFAATIVGMTAGGAPQTPLTFKRLEYSNFVYCLTKKEREKALQAGILHSRLLNGYWIINQGITSLLDNKQTYALNGETLEFSIALIKAQINKELILEGEARFIGLTAAQASPQSVKDFTETKLSSLVASVGNDNLILSWRNVKVRTDNSDYYITYDFVPNIPVNKTFFIGNVLDFKVTI